MGLVDAARPGGVTGLTEETKDACAFLLACTAGYPWLRLFWREVGRTPGFAFFRLPPISENI